MAGPDPLFMLRGSAQPITALCPIVSQSKLVVGTQSGAIYLWDLRTRRIISRSEHAHTQPVLCIYGNADDVTTQGRDGVIRKWKLTDDLEPNGQIDYDAVGFCPMLVTPSYICVTSNQSPGQLNLLATGDRCYDNLVVKETSERKYGMAMVARQRGDVIFVGYEDGSVAGWNCSSSEMLSRLKLHDDSVMALDVSQNTQRGISGSVDSKIELWSWNDRFEITSVRKIEMPNAGVNSIRIRRDDKIFVCACWDHSVRVFSMKKFSPLAILQAHKAAVRCLEFDESDLLYVGSDDQIVSVWGIYR